MSEHYFTAQPESAHEDRRFTIAWAGRTLAFETDAGVFSKQHVDPGSELLCRCLPEALSGRVLDLGCGWGAMSVLAMAAHPGIRVVMADVNERALDLARRNAQGNGMEAEAVLSDGFDAVEGEFDCIMTNPPIRAGKAVIYRMFEQAAEHLRPGGMLILVIRKQQGAPSALAFLKGVYARAEVIEKEHGYWIIQCIKEADDAV